MKFRDWIVVCAALGFGAVLYFLLIAPDSDRVAQSAPPRAEREPAKAMPVKRPPPEDAFTPGGGAVAPPPDGLQQSAPPEMLPATAIRDEVRTQLDEARTQSESHMKEHLAAVAASFSRESRDQRWSSEIGEALQAALGTEELAGTALQSIDCRTTTCRIEVQDDGSGRLPAILPMLAVQMAGSLPNLVAERIGQPDGKTTMVLYMSR